MTILLFTPQPREEHLHLQVGRVLRLVEDHERVAERAAAHERERRDLDRARLQRLDHALGRHHLVERIVERPQVRVDLGLHVSGQEAQRLARLDRRPREHDAPHPLPHERVHRHGDGEVGLPGPAGPIRRRRRSRRSCACTRLARSS
jgi:hypothetical protein